jgi:PAS domain S-box-containing protein
LSESEQRFRQLFEQSVDALFVHDEDGRFVDCNSQACRLLGYSREELLDLSVKDVSDNLLTEEERALREKQGGTLWQRALAGEPGTFALSHEEDNRRKDGSNFPVEVRVGSVDYGGRRMILASVRDITERKRAEEALQESHRRTRNIIESITEGFFAVDREWRYTYINERALGTIQRAQGEVLTREDLLGKNVWELFPETVGSVFDRKYHEALREQKTIQFEAYSPLSDMWFGVHVYPTEEGLAVYSRDITDRKRTEKEIERRTHQQALVAELGRQALAETDLLALMDQAVSLVAQTLDVEYCKILELLPEGDELLLRAGVGWEEGLVGRATEGTGLDSQAGFTLLSGEPVIVEDLREEERFSASALLHDHGAVSGMSVIILKREQPFGILGVHTKSRRAFTGDDVNFLQAVANVLAAAIERMEVAETLREVRDTERNRLARDLHDEPLQDLTRALAETQLLQRMSEYEKLNHRLERVVEALKKAGQGVHTAIYDLRLEDAGREQTLVEMLESLVDLTREGSPDCEIELSVEDGFSSTFSGERQVEVFRILREALTNVLRHSEADHVRIAAGGISESRLWAEVEDDGRGFDPTQPTAGLGLKGMRERARALGGDLKIGSKPGEGTKVRFELAHQRDQAEPEEEVRILLVDDHVSIRQAMASMFEREADFVVVGQAGSLSEARQTLGASQKVDVAVLDLRLPDGYGGELINELRTHSPQAQALVLSAILDRPELARAVESGAAGVLHKSAGMDEVVEAVRRLRAGETLLPLEEVVELLRFASSQREGEYKARQAIARLTSREKEILQAIAEGLDSKEIAERLHISVKTEANHVTSILNKLGVHSRLQALVFAVRHGVVEIH